MFDQRENYITCSNLHNLGTLRTIHFQILIDELSLPLKVDIRKQKWNNIMKRLAILLILIAGCFALRAQTGLFNLSYAIPIEEADSLLTQIDFYTPNFNDNLVRYYPKTSSYVEAILVFVEPKTRRIVGWFIKYSPDNSEEDDAYILQTLQELHGKTNQYDEETQQLIWFLSTTRSVHIMYADDNSLTVLYYDAHFPELFHIPGSPALIEKPETDGSNPPKDTNPPSAEQDAR
ncbi:MAG TPA: hypothetical protein PKI37_01435 [Candidatus Cloacimonas sp.]|nr:hypothetical protein [Candidatus Cloacimonas sp.]